MIKCGFPDIWQNQNVLNPKWLKLSIKQKLKDLYINDWFSAMKKSKNNTVKPRLFECRWALKNHSDNPWFRIIHFSMTYWLETINSVLSVYCKGVNSRMQKWRYLSDNKNKIKCITNTYYLSLFYECIWVNKWNNNSC